MITSKSTTHHREIELDTYGKAVDPHCHIALSGANRFIRQTLFRRLSAEKWIFFIKCPQYTGLARVRKVNVRTVSIAELEVGRTSREKAYHDVPYSDVEGVHIPGTD